VKVMNNPDEIKALFEQMNVADIAELLEKTDSADAIVAFRLLEEGPAADVFSYLSPKMQQLIVGGLTDTEVEEIMEDLPIDDMVDFLEDAPDDMEKRVLDSVSTEKGEIVDRLLDYPEDSAGSLMTTEIVELSPKMTARIALQTIRTSGVDKETIFTCYVIDEERTLIGVVTADTLIYAGVNEKVSDLMDTNFIFAEAGDDQEELSNKFSKYDLLAMPVVSRGNHLVGIVTIDDILRVKTEEDTDDFANIVGVRSTETSYMNTGIFKHVKSRFVWLLVLMLAATIAGMIIETFEDALGSLPILMAFIPMLMGAGGNAGAQSSTIVIRGMSLGEIAVSDVLKLVWIETRIAILCSLVLGAANFIRIFIMYGNSETVDSLTLAWVVSLSLCITLIVAKTIGCSLPILAKKLKLDPAVMAAPIITTIVDVTALIVFFMISYSVLL